MKRKVIGLLIAIFAFCFITNVDALTITTNSSVQGTVDTNSYLITNTGTITINDTVGDTQFYAYKVLDAFYNSSSNVITYEFTSAFKTFLAQSSNYKNLTVDDYYKLTSGDITSGSTQTDSTLDVLVSEYTTFIKSSTGYSYKSFTNNTFLTTEAGAYLILPYNTNYVYGVMVANIERVVGTDDEYFSSPTINAKVTDMSIFKYVGKINNIVASYNIGYEYPYILIVNVPQFPTNAPYTNFGITDWVDEGITIDDDPSTYILWDGTTKLTTKSDGTVVDADGNVVATVSLDYPQPYSLPNDTAYRNIDIEINTKYVTSNQIRVEFKAMLNSNASLGDTYGNVNYAKLYYSDPYSGSSMQSESVSAVVYTYGLRLLAYKSGNKSVVIPNASFDIYSDANLTNKVGSITTESDGYGMFPGLAEGTYYLKQIKTASGYGLEKNTISVKVKSTGAVADASNEGYYLVEVAIPKAGLLPFTGGSGSLMFTIIGLIVIVMSVVAIAIYRIKNGAIINE